MIDQLHPLRPEVKTFSSEAQEESLTEKAARSPELAGALALLTELHALRESRWLLEASECQRCYGGPDPCHRPDGSSYVETRSWCPERAGEPRYHASRLRAYVRLFNGAPVDLWLLDLDHFVEPAEIIARAKRSKLYRLAVRRQMLKWGQSRGPAGVGAVAGACGAVAHTQTGPLVPLLGVRTATQ